MFDPLTVYPDEVAALCTEGETPLAAASVAYFSGREHTGRETTLDLSDRIIGHLLGLPIYTDEAAEVVAGVSLEGAPGTLGHTFAPHEQQVIAGRLVAGGRIRIDAEAGRRQGRVEPTPELIPEMLKKWQEGYDVVYGTRTERPGESAFKLATVTCPPPAVPG